MATPKGTAMTVMGPVPLESLGIVLPHEHLPCNIKGFLSDSVQLPSSNMPDCPFSLENLWWIRQYPYHHKSNCNFGDDSVQEAVLHDLKFFKKSGGRTVIDCSTRGIDRIPKFTRKAATETGVNVIAGTGFYVAALQPESNLNLTEEEISNVMRTELFDGFDGTDMKCGIIGELGTSWPIHSFEKKVLRAAGNLQSEIGIPINVHPGRGEDAPKEVLRLLLEAGAKTERIIMSHLERTIMDDENLLEFAARGCYCEFDLFGIEVSHYQLNPNIDMPSDAQRIARIKMLIKEGFQNRILLSHDIHTKHRLMKFGGHGFSHILLNVIPQMMERGISKELIDEMTIDNPRNVLAYT